MEWGEGGGVGVCVCVCRKLGTVCSTQPFGCIPLAAEVNNPELKGQRQPRCSTFAIVYEAGLHTLFSFSKYTFSSGCFLQATALFAFLGSNLWKIHFF